MVAPFKEYKAYTIHNSEDILEEGNIYNTISIDDDEITENKVDVNIKALW